MKILNLTLIGVILLFWSSLSYGYIDPGTGSAIMSAIIGFFVAIGMAVKTYWYKLKGLFVKKQKPDGELKDIVEDVKE